MPSSEPILPDGEGGLHLVGGAAQGEIVGVAGDHPPRQVELLELQAGVAAADLGRHVDAPELGADAAGSQPRQVRVATSREGQVVARRIAVGLAILANRPRQVVVAVDERVLVAEERSRALHQPGSGSGIGRG
jgi:hypothetical protein